MDSSLAARTDIVRVWRRARAPAISGQGVRSTVSPGSCRGWGEEPTGLTQSGSAYSRKDADNVRAVHRSPRLLRLLRTESTAAEGVSCQNVCRLGADHAADAITVGFGSAQQYSHSRSSEWLHSSRGTHHRTR